MPLIAPPMHQHKLVFTHMAYPLPAPLLPLLSVPCFISTFLYFVLISSTPAPAPIQQGPPVSLFLSVSQSFPNITADVSACSSRPYDCIVGDEPYVQLMATSSFKTISNCIDVVVIHEICILLSSRLFSEAFHVWLSARAFLRGSFVCFSKLQVAFYALNDDAGVIQNT